MPLYLEAKLASSRQPHRGFTDAYRDMVMLQVLTLALGNLSHTAIGREANYGRR